MTAIPPASCDPHTQRRRWLEGHTSVEFHVLGPIRVWRSGTELAVGSGRERFVLATLLLSAGCLVPADSVIDALWTDPPRSAMAQLYNMISALRRRLGDDLIITRPGGYELRLGDATLDLACFEDLLARGDQ